jgi:hypothetical protein
VVEDPALEGLEIDSIEKQLREILDQRDATMVKPATREKQSIEISYHTAVHVLLPATA